MIDYFAIVVTHGAMALALWRLMARDDLDREEPPAPLPDLKADRRV